jgi:hypothetical protein
MSGLAREILLAFRGPQGLPAGCGVPGYKALGKIRRVGRVPSESRQLFVGANEKSCGFVGPDKGQYIIGRPTWALWMAYRRAAEGGCRA